MSDPQTSAQKFSGDTRRNKLVLTSTVKRQMPNPLVNAHVTLLNQPVLVLPTGTLRNAGKLANDPLPSTSGKREPRGQNTIVAQVLSPGLLLRPGRSAAPRSIAADR